MTNPTWLRLISQLTPPKRKTLTVQQEQGRLPAEVWDESFHYLNASSLAQVRLVNQFFNTLATRLFFRCATFYPDPSSDRKILSFMSCVTYGKPENGLAVRELELYLVRKSRLIERHGRAVGHGLREIPNLRKLLLDFSSQEYEYPPQCQVSVIFASVNFSQIEEFTFRGYLSEMLQDFISRHASTLKVLEVDARPLPGYTEPGTPGPPFIALRRAIVRPEILRLLVRSGMPALKQFELVWFHGASMAATRNALLVLAQSAGKTLEELEFRVIGFEENVFKTVSQNFPRLKSLLIYSSPGLFTPQTEKWGEMASLFSPHLRATGSQILTKLVSLRWDSPVRDGWDNSWKYVLQIAECNPKLERITLPESRVWLRIDKAFWIPSDMSATELGYRSLMDSILQRKYPYLGSFIASVEAGLVRHGNSTNSTAWTDIDSLKQLCKGPIPSSAVHSLLQLARDVDLY
ncbi:hypothetical protein VNI00_016095 [Paramarasmius palmivorus]|uniref:F-box domain-containing protein n=1 Tax=Paramarasmius palmivorus TaxID=297713 RepID=A0AAW0BGD4_9AGAR